jgi:DNA primase
MAGRIRQEDIAAVRERSPIADVIGEYIQLRPAGGGNLKGLCPFHDERTPSFNVTSGKELYHCFSCDAGGDVIKFVMEIEHLTFTESVERLAARANIPLRYEQGGYVPGQETGQKRRLIEAHRAAEEFYADRLRSRPDAAPGREFLSQRGFELSDAERFGVGHSPKAWDELTKHLRARGFSDDELVKAGLARKGQRGLIDMFRGRLMWPVRDITGETIAFGARKLDPDDDSPKYLNTPETPLFKKGQVLYGADLAKREIAKRRQAVIVEGYTDVMACHLSGVPTAVATCGTSFGEDHVKVLRRLIMDTEGSDGEVIFTFDGDAAGQKAALRAFSLEEKFATQTFVAVQPDGLDPCDLRLKHGEAAVRDLIARRVPLFEFAIRSALSKHDLDTTEGQLAALDEAAPIVAKIKDAGLRGRYAVNLDRWLGLMNERFVLQRVRQHGGVGRNSGVGRAVGPGRAGGTGTVSGPGGSGRAGGSGTPSNGTAGANNANGAGDGGPGGRSRFEQDERYDRSDPALRVEREALKLAVQVPALCGPTFDALGIPSFTVAQHQRVVTLIAQCGGVSGAGRPKDWAARLIEEAPDDRARTFLRELILEQLQVAADPDTAYVEVILARVAELAISRQITAVKARLQRMNPIDEQVEYNRLFGDLMALEQRRQALLKRATGG